MTDYEIIRRFINHVSEHVGMAQSAAARTALDRIIAENTHLKNQARKVKNALNNARSGRRGGCC